MNKFLNVINKGFGVVNGVGALLCAISGIIYWTEGDIYALMILLWFPMAFLLGTSACLGYRFSKTKQMLSLAIGLFGLCFSIVCIISSFDIILNFLEDGTIYV